jgi:hypothetical protein
MATAFQAAPSTVALIELRVDGVVGVNVTVIVAVPRAPWYVAVIVTAPEVAAVTTPLVETLAIDALEDCHVAMAVTFCVEPLDNVAVAVSCTVCPALVRGVTPLTVIDDTAGDGAEGFAGELAQDHVHTMVRSTRKKFGSFIALSALGFIALSALGRSLLLIGVSGRFLSTAPE